MHAEHGMCMCSGLPVTFLLHVFRAITQMRLVMHKLIDHFYCISNILVLIQFILYRYARILEAFLFSLKHLMKFHKLGAACKNSLSN